VNGGEDYPVKYSSRPTGRPKHFTAQGHATVPKGHRLGQPGNEPFVQGRRRARPFVNDVQVQDPWGYRAALAHEVLHDTNRFAIGQYGSRHRGSKRFYAFQIPPISPIAFPVGITIATAPKQAVFFDRKRRHYIYYTPLHFLPPPESQLKIKPTFLFRSRLEKEDKKERVVDIMYFINFFIFLYTSIHVTNMLLFVLSKGVYYYYFLHFFFLLFFFFFFFLPSSSSFAQKSFVN
jgi:hypothetical protein